MSMNAEQARRYNAERKARAEAMRASSYGAESVLHHPDELREFAAWRRQGQLFGAAPKPVADFNITETRVIVRKVSSGHVISYRRMGNFRGLFSDHY